jgi:hypothetical protein
MNHRLTHMLVGIVAATLIVAMIAFSLVVTVFSRSGAETLAFRPAVPRIVHPTGQRMADCVRCHLSGRAGMQRSHATYGGTTCLTCHRGAPVAMRKAVEGAKDATPGAMPHPAILPYDDCVGCHAAGGNLGMPDDHAEYANDTCTGCHAGPAAERADGAAGR